MAGLNFGGVAMGLGGEGEAMQRAKENIYKQRREKMQDQLQQAYLDLQKQQVSIQQQREWLTQQLELKKEVIGNPIQTKDGSYAVFTRDPQSGAVALEVLPTSFKGRTPVDELLDEKKALKDAGFSDAQIASYLGYSPKNPPSETELQKLGDKIELYELLKDKDPKLAAALMGAPMVKVMGFGAAPGEGPETVDDYLGSVAHGDITSPTQIPTKIRGKVLSQMSSQGVHFLRKPTQIEQRAFDGMTDFSVVADQLLPMLDKLKDAKGNLPNSWLDVAKSKGTMWEYLAGKVPGAPDSMGDPDIQEAIKQYASLSQLAGAMPWTAISRSKVVYEDIKKHLPNPGGDTPRMMYDKIINMQRILAKMWAEKAKGTIMQVQDNPYEADTSDDLYQKALQEAQQ